MFWRNVVEPVVEYQFGPENRIGVKYRNNIYRSEDIANNDSIENYIGPFLTYWFNRQHGISLDYGYTNGYFESDPDLNGHRVGGAYMLRFTPKATASLKGAYTKQTYTDEWLDYEIYETSLGLSYLFSPTLSASVEAGYYWMEPTIGSRKSKTVLPSRRTSPSSTRAPPIGSACRAVTPRICSPLKILAFENITGQPDPSRIFWTGDYPSAAWAAWSGLNQSRTGGIPYGVRVPTSLIYPSSG